MMRNSTIVERVNGVDESCLNDAMTQMELRQLPRVISLPWRLLP
mgnify:CR=1 FL=1